MNFAAPTRLPGSRRRWGLLLAALLIAAPVGARYEGPKSDHFDGKVFRNLVPTPHKSVWTLIRWRLTREVEGEWTYRDNPEFNGVREERVHGQRMVVTFVNHSTVLVQTGGINLLTDPIWSKRCSPVSFIGPDRHHPPGIAFEDLPPIDAVVVSHNHYDHLDLPTLERLHRDHKPVIMVGLGNGQLLRDRGIDTVEEMDWWDRRELAPGVAVHMVPAQHWSARTRFDTNRTLWGGYVMEAPGGPLFFAGDTGGGPHFRMIRERFGPMRFSLLPVGAFLPRWFMKDNHLSPADALEVHRELESRESMAIHFGTFELGDDGQFHAVKLLRKLRAEQGMPAKEFWVPRVGIPKEVRAY